MEIKLFLTHSLKNPDVRRFLVMVLGGFCGAALAIVWNNVLTVSLSWVQESSHLMSFWGAVLFAIIITALLVGGGIFIIQKINKYAETQGKNN